MNQFAPTPTRQPYFRPRPQPVAAPAPVQPGYAPTAAGPAFHDPNAIRPPGGHSNNFLASVKYNNAANEAAATATKAIVSSPRGYQPAMPRTNPDGTPAMKTLTGTAPDGSPVVRQVQQYDDATDTVQGRKDVHTTVPGIAAAAGQNAANNYYAGLSAQQQQAADIADPKGAEQRAHADAYRADAFSKTLIAPHQAGEIDARAGEHQANGQYKMGMLPVDQQKGTAQAGMYTAQGNLATANAGHVTAMTPVDVNRGTQQARDAGTHADLNTANAASVPGRADAQNQRDVADAHHSEALALNPHITNPGHEYAAQRQHVDDQINQFKSQIANNPSSPDLPLWKATLEKLVAQKTRLSGQHVDQAVQPSTPPPVPVTSAPPPPPNPPTASYQPGGSGSFFGVGGTTDPTLSLSPAGYRPGPPPSSPAAPSPAGGPARVSSDAEFHALPSGSTFVDPNGVRRRKP